MLVVACNEQLPLQEARTGDPEAWDALFKRYQLPLYVYLFGLLHDEQTSLDIVQETFINAVRHIERLQNDAKFGSWLFSIAHQKCIQQWRKQKWEERFDDDDFADWPADDDNPRDWLIRKEREEEFMDWLSQLPPPQRSVLLLHFMEEFSLDEIAGITGTSPGTVKSRIHYAKRALRKLIEEDNGS